MSDHIAAPTTYGPGASWGPSAWESASHTASSDANPAAERRHDAAPSRAGRGQLLQRGLPALCAAGPTPVPPAGCAAVWCRAAAALGGCPAAPVWPAPDGVIAFIARP